MELNCDNLIKITEQILIFLIKPTMNWDYPGKNILKNEAMLLNSKIKYEQITGLSKEAQEKLSKTKPENMGQAMRISGVTISDAAVLSVYVTKKNRVSRET